MKTTIRTLGLGAAALLLAACGGGGGNSTPVVVNPSTIVGLTLDNPAAPSKIYVANADLQIIQVVDLATNSVSTLAGASGASGIADGTGAAARFNEPYAVVMANGVLYVADTINHSLRRLTSAGVVTTIAGNPGVLGTTDGTGTAATFNRPKSLVVDASSTFAYVVDSYNHAIRKLTLATGAVSTLAGSAGAAGYVDAAGSAARFSFPFGVALDGGGNLYVTDASNNAVRQVTPAGVVSTLAGSPSSLAGSVDGIGVAARFYAPTGIACDGTNLYVADTVNQVIRKIEIATQQVTTLAGSAGSAGSSDGIGSAARFNGPIGMAIDAAGNLYVSDQDYLKIRKVTAAGVVTTLAASF